MAPDDISFSVAVEISKPLDGPVCRGATERFGSDHSRAVHGPRVHRTGRIPPENAGARLTAYCAACYIGVVGVLAHAEGAHAKTVGRAVDHGGIGIARYSRASPGDFRERPSAGAPLDREAELVHGCRHPAQGK